MALPPSISANTETYVSLYAISFSFYLFPILCLLCIFKSQIFRDELVVRVLEKRIMLHFVLFVPVVSLFMLRVICFFLIYVTNYLDDVLNAML